MTIPVYEVTDELECPDCDQTMKRDLKADLLGVPVHYNSQGFHRTDYDATGDKLEKLNRSWSKITGEEPPPVSSEIKRNSRGKQ